MTDEPICWVCHIPLRAVVSHVDGRCSDIEACNLRRELLSEHGVAHLITTEGVTRIDP